MPKKTNNHINNDDILDKMHKEHTLPYKIAVDVLGVLLIVLSCLVGWLPGPGGLPIFLAGLALLAKNHSWAKNLLTTVKTRGAKILKTFFKNHPVLVIIYDIVAILIVILVLVWFYKTESFKWLAPILMILSAALVIILGNRNRYSAIKRKLEKLIH